MCGREEDTEGLSTWIDELMAKWEYGTGTKGLSVESEGDEGEHPHGLCVE
jgi:hypothetical protein